MSVYTFTTDFGLCDHYAASLKGEILKLEAAATLIDVTHECSILQWMNAAFILANTLPHFPQGTVHIVAVNIFYTSKAKLICCNVRGQWLIMPDNGLIGILFADLMPEVFEVKLLNGENYFRDYLKIYARVAYALAQNKAATLDLQTISEFRLYNPHRPYATEKQLHGQVVHINHYGNAVTNITKDLFESEWKNRPYKIFDKSRENGSQILDAYISSKESQKIIFFNAHGFLEIAMHGGAASKLFNLKYGDNIVIQFSEIQNPIR